jgi:hypothetical protein
MRLRTAFCAALVGAYFVQVIGSSAGDSRIYTNTRYGYAVGYPASLLNPQPESDAGDGRAFLAKKGKAKFLVYGGYNVLRTSPEKLASDAEADCPGHHASYRTVKSYLVAVSCTVGPSVLYQKTIIGGGKFATVRGTYPSAESSTWNVVASSMAHSMKFIDVSYATPAAVGSTPHPKYSDFLAAVAPAQRNITIATFAVTCNLRSQQWLSVFFVSYQQYMQLTANQYHVGIDGLNAADTQAMKITHDLHETITCRGLLNSATMDRLDALEDKITGGYR